jgi:heptosyltransferase-1
MKKVLIAKLASLGDLIHALPALSDASKMVEGIRFDWLVDKNFQEIPLWHSSVDRVIPTNHRGWRAHPFARSSWSEFSNALKTLKQESYDLIIDAQGNLKSSIFSRLVDSNIAGWDAKSAPEWGSHLLYKTSYFADKNLHAIERLRTLFASALGYEKPTSAPSYQINRSKLILPPLDLPSRYLLFVPIASYESKLWLDSYWQELIHLAVKEGYSILLPWGHPKEKERALRLQIDPAVTVLPKLSLSEIGALIAKAEGVISLDTGLSHLSAALETPCVTLYGPTDPKLTGTVGPKQIHLKPSSFTCPSECKKSCSLKDKTSRCLEQIQPVSVWEAWKVLKS